MIDTEHQRSLIHWISIFMLLRSPQFTNKINIVKPDTYIMVLSFIKLVRRIYLQYIFFINKMYSLNIPIPTQQSNSYRILVILPSKHIIRHSRRSVWIHGRVGLSMTFAFDPNSKNTINRITNIRLCTFINIYYIVLIDVPM